MADLPTMQHREPSEQLLRHLPALTLPVGRSLDVFRDVPVRHILHRKEHIPTGILEPPK